MIQIIKKVCKRSAIRYGHSAVLAAFAVSLIIHSSAFAVSANPETGKNANQIEVELTAYSSTESQTDSTPLISASGKTVHDGMVAANFLPFGTKIKIPSLFGDKIFTVGDRMNKRFQNRIDVWFSNTEAAIKFGFKKAFIEIVE
ncbi:MAG: hypothetical protein PHD04_05335 [Candidatus Pacebacteria bacterium]|nr:hypothetical protein [Candidatus Paceibacterota bacterium]